MGILDDIATEIGKGSSSAKGGTLPSSLPETYASKDLVPVFGKTPDQKLQEYKVRTAAQQMGIDPHIAAGVAYQESGFNQNATSPTGVKGTMQLTKETGQRFGYDRNDPDQQILGGVAALKEGFDKHPDNPAKAISIYPNPKDIPKYVPAVLNHAEKSRTLADSPEVAAQVGSPISAMIGDEIKSPAGDSGNVNVGNVQASTPQEGTSEADNTNWASKGLAFAKGATKHIGFPNPSAPNEYIAGKIAGLFGATPPPVKLGYNISDTLTDLANNKRLQRENEGLRYIFSGGKDTRSFEEAAQKGAPQVAQAVKANPYSAGAGGIVGSMIGPTGKITGAVTGAKGLGVILKTILGGALQAGQDRAVSDPNASAGDVATSTGLGAATGLLFSPAAKGLSYLGDTALDRIAGTKGASKYIMDKFGLTKNLESLSEKNQNLLNTNIGQRNSLLQENPQQLVNLPAMAEGKNPLYPKDIEDLAEKYAGAKDLVTSSRLLAIAKAARGNGNALVKDDANYLRQILSENSRGENGAVQSGIAPRVLDEWRRHLKEGIENVGGSKIGEVNKDIGTGADISRATRTAMTEPDKMPSWNPMTNVLRTVPGATGVSALGNSVTPAIAKVLSLIVPGLFTGK